MRIGVDIDGCIRDIHEKLVKVYKREYPDGWCEAPSHWYQYEISPFFSIEKDIYPFWFIAHSKEIYTQSLPYPNVREDLLTLKGVGHVIDIITSQPNKKCELYTWQWLQDFEIPYDSFHVTKNKYKVDCDLYIEDAPHFINEYLENDKNVICRTHGWNKNEPYIKRVDSFSHFAENIIKGRYDYEVTNSSVR